MFRAHLDCFRAASLVKKPAMTGSRKVLLVLAALAVTAYFLPVTRDELAWWWAQSHDHSDNYFRYLSDWPQGRHVVEARVCCHQRQWAESKRAEILQAATMATMASPPNSDTEAAYRRERATRRDNFFWKQATNLDTLASYHDYLNQFPAGRHAGAARQKIQSLGQPAAGTSAPQQ
jgi:hypothetical protein